MLIQIEECTQGTMWIEATMVMDVYWDGTAYEIVMGKWCHNDNQFRTYRTKDDPVAIINAGKR